MPLRFFADHCISNYIIQRLRGAGCEVFKLRDYLPKDSPDSIVIEEARNRDAILLTLNGDFSDIITYPPQRYEGIIALRVKNHPETIPPIMDRLIEYMQTNPSFIHYSGKLFVVETERIRIRS